MHVCRHKFLVVQLVYMHIVEVICTQLEIVLTFQIKALHLYDCLRANKSTSAWGVQARVPFLDKNFINVAMDIDPEWKMVLPCTTIIFDIRFHSE
jgi:hypothetical protein